MSEISINDIPQVETYSVKLGLSSTSENGDTIKYHSYSTPSFYWSLEEARAILLKHDLPTDKYKLIYQKSNKGHLKCKNDKIPIQEGKPCIRLTEITKVEDSERVYFKSWIFGTEECLNEWLKENNPEWML